MTPERLQELKRWFANGDGFTRPNLEEIFAEIDRLTRELAEMKRQAEEPSSAEWDTYQHNIKLEAENARLLEAAHTLHEMYYNSRCVPGHGCKVESALQIERPQPSGSNPVNPLGRKSKSSSSKENQ